MTAGASTASAASSCRRRRPSAAGRGSRRSYASSRSTRGATSSSRQVARCTQRAWSGRTAALCAVPACTPSSPAPCPPAILRRLPRGAQGCSVLATRDPAGVVNHPQVLSILEQLLKAGDGLLDQGGPELPASSLAGAFLSNLGKQLIPEPAPGQTIRWARRGGRGGEGAAAFRRARGETWNVQVSTRGPSSQARWPAANMTDQSCQVPEWQVDDDDAAPACCPDLSCRLCVCLRAACRCLSCRARWH